MHQFAALSASLILITLAAATHNIPGDVSINCGSFGTSAVHNGREWIGDIRTKSSSSHVEINGSSFIQKLISDDPVPYRTVRISRSRFSYTFRLKPGQKLIRLHFNPAFEKFKDLFNVQAGDFILLSNFSASLTADALGVKFIVKEYCINVEHDQFLNIIFSSAISDSTYAFVNGVEIISVPARGLYLFHGGIEVIGENFVGYVDGSAALEIVHRQQIERDSVSLVGADFSDVFGMWSTVRKQKANKINNYSWNISVGVGFRYLVRFHFCDVGLKMAEIGSMNFAVLINEIVANTNVDIAKERDYNGISSYYKDYMVMIKGLKQEGNRDLLLSLQSDSEFFDPHGFLKGFEILKLSNYDNSLASPNPLPPKHDSPLLTIPTLLSVFGQRNAIATVAISIIAFVNIIVHKLREVWEASCAEEENKPSARAERFCRRFSLAEIQVATRNFSDALVIGMGGFGKVYKGLIDNGQETVAIKRLKSNSRQGAHEFLTEIETLSELRHVNLVSLIGYCNENGEMILVYEYVSSGTLADHLYKLARDGNNSSSLTWKQCLNICIGAGRGLDYLHTGHRVIHRDVKASNILLDENFEAKVSDFGLAKPEDRSKLESHVSTNVKGTFGYLDPNYLYTRKLTRKSDTYAFGVVLMEVLCGRSAVASKVAEDEHILAKWARDKISKGEVDQIVASSLREEISPDSLKTFVGVAERCLHDEPKKRPTMSQVVLQLELALELQHERTIFTAPNDITSSADISQTNNAQLTISSLEEQTNRKAGNAATGRKDERKLTVRKPSQLLRWDSIWNIVMPFKRKQLVSISITESSETGVKLPKFDFAGIADATNQFSFSNKIGEGIIGTVYKGVFSTGLKVAVKLRKPSSLSEKGLKNEFLLLPKLHHPNIVKLLGYCLHREEIMLVYELMEKGNLASFLYDEVLYGELEWAVRFKIIMGIARGLVYLHQDSGLRIIHSHLIPENILLDIEMNPKISTFGFAKTLAEHQSELEAKPIISTSQFTSPEYCHGEGKLSLKSDVYSFGVLVLEIVSGRSSSSYKPNRGSQVLVDLAIELWNEGKALDIVDASMVETYSEEALRCIQVGISCIQPQPGKRPTMPSVVKFLEGLESSLGLQQETVSEGIESNRPTTSEDDPSSIGWAKASTS
ncbi:hypothetical protein BUALT_Bualt04G0134700 [Buddleja alternifolia]|uniref:non-specific serine/threonine protein kinase n=1 Tax=Buddleja alternifolia TaxID=168488 RepID=A0AAV6XZX6_9LAMI|nr:hypothetical protein BUALT_Bualt04G0134700 [Buddleja alternifolia]